MRMPGTAQIIKPKLIKHDEKNVLWLCHAITAFVFESVALWLSTADLFIWRHVGDKGQISVVKQNRFVNRKTTTS